MLKAVLVGTVILCVVFLAWVALWVALVTRGPEGQR